MADMPAASATQTVTWCEVTHNPVLALATDGSVSCLRAESPPAPGGRFRRRTLAQREIPSTYELLAVVGAHERLPRKEASSTVARPAFVAARHAEPARAS
jgi:hypothetical protein